MTTRCTTCSTGLTGPRTIGRTRRLQLNATSWATTAALQEGVELVLDGLRQVGADTVFSLRDDRRDVLLH